MTFLNNNKVLVGIVLTFLVSGLGGVTGMVSPGVAAWFALIINGLTAIGHASNIATAARKN